MSDSSKNSQSLSSAVGSSSGSTAGPAIGSKEMTQKVARLARLKLTDEELTTFTNQVGDILKYVEKLQEVNVEGVAPMTHPLDLATPLRDDVAVPSPTNAEGKPKVLDAAPDVLNDGYKVPPIL
jgi:aspartyl-tRNA(Asn)/glutamyl-tRNA(Gln) amidotransferase subunit C